MKGLFALLILAAPLAAVAADKPDASFYKQAAESGMFEVDVGNMAQTAGKSQAVKDFGAMMVKDHSAANDKLANIAAAKSIETPHSSSVGQMATEAKLKVLTGDTFDKSYIKSQIKAHQETLGLLKKEIASGQDPEAKAWATSVLPTVQDHLKKIKAIAADAGVTKT